MAVPWSLSRLTQNRFCVVMQARLSQRPASSFCRRTIWRASRKLPRFLLHERLVPKDVSLLSGHTQPPPLLTEADLIDKMDKHGIGTDATMHEHIRTIQERNYAIQTESQQFKPTDLGVALVKGYKVVGHLCKEDLSRVSGW
ncbi:hypothetical protein ACSSS7_007049 [Eimeria intestinalis]